MLPHIPLFTAPEIFFVRFPPKNISFICTCIYIYLLIYLYLLYICIYIGGDDVFAISGGIAIGFEGEKRWMGDGRLGKGERTTRTLFLFSCAFCRPVLALVLMNRLSTYSCRSFFLVYFIVANREHICTYIEGVSRGNGGKSRLIIWVYRYRVFCSCLFRREVIE